LKEREGSSPSARTIAIGVFAQVNRVFQRCCGASYSPRERILSTLSCEYRACNVTETASKSSSKRSL
jgi:hypothetical protein